MSVVVFIAYMFAQYKFENVSQCNDDQSNMLLFNFKSSWLKKIHINVFCRHTGICKDCFVVDG